MTLSMRFAWATLLLMLTVSSAIGSEISAEEALRALPLLEFRSQSRDPHLLILLTGDGGWRRIDSDVTECLNKRGVSVVGFDVPQYYKVERSPQQSADDLTLVIRHYASQWGKRKVILAGYSRGASVLPFLVSRLPADVNQLVDEVVLLGVEREIDFAYHPFWWDSLGYRSKEKQYPVADELKKLRGRKILCFYGVEDPDCICSSLDPTLVKRIPEPGDHHFGGDYCGIARKIVESLGETSAP